MTPQTAVNIEDLRGMARRRVPRAVFDYIDGGAEAEATLRENRRAFETLSFRPRHAVPVGGCDLRTRVLGADLSLPVLLAPVGYSRLMHPEGERAAARAAGEAGTAYILSTISGHRLEDVRAASRGPVWYQLYLLGGRPAAEGALDRAQRAGFGVLVITIDTAVAGLRERDLRNGTPQLMSGRLGAMLPYLPQVVRRPRWLTSFLRDGGVPHLPNVVIPGTGPLPMLDVATSLNDSCFVWQDLAWIRKSWTGPFIIKGVLTGEDARRAVDEGAAGVVVSNHGGRQLDSAPATLRVLPEVVAAVKGRAEVLMDGGIRRGTDVLKALCLGARAVLIGRAYAYGLAAGGPEGVTRAIEILQADLHRNLKLLGCQSLGQLDPSYLNVPPGWPALS